MSGLLRHRLSLLDRYLNRRLRGSDNRTVEGRFEELGVASVLSRRENWRPGACWKTVLG